MLDDALIGGFGDAPVQAAKGFRAALNVMARPGAIEAVEGAAAPSPASNAAATLLLTLCDAETPIHLVGAHDCEALRKWITFHIGAPLVGPESAVFVLGDWDALQPLHRFQVGTPQYPDRSATLIVEMENLSNTGASLAGPGIKETASLSLPAIEPFQLNNALFPLGHDFYFSCGDQMAALPRSTKVRTD